MLLFWRKYQQVIVMSAIVLAGLALVYAMRSAVFPFVIGITFAYLLLPVVAWIEQRLPRNKKYRARARLAAIFAIYAVALALFLLFMLYVGSAILHSVVDLIRNAPQYTTTALTGQLLQPLQQIVPVQYRDDVATLLTTVSGMMGGAVTDSFSKGVTSIPSTVSFVVSFFTMPFFMFYVIKDWNQLRKVFIDGLPDWVSLHSRNILTIMGSVLGKYLKAQLILGTAVGLLDYIGMLILGVPLAPVLGLFGGATEMIPVIGPWIGTVTAVIVTLAFAPTKVLWVLAWFGGVQLLENIFLVPRIHGGQLNLHPALTMVLLVVGTFVAGFWGIILVLPLTAMMIQIGKYWSSSIRNPQLSFAEFAQAPAAAAPAGQPAAVAAPARTTEPTT